MAINNTDELRSLLSGVLEKVIDGSVAPNQANAVSNLVGKFMQTVQLDLKYHMMRDSMPEMKFLNHKQEDIQVEDKTTGELKGV